MSYEKCLVSNSSLHPVGSFAPRRGVTFEQSEFKWRTKGLYLTWGPQKGGGIFNRAFVNVSLAEFWAIGNGNYFLRCENLCSIKMYFICKKIMTAQEIPRMLWISYKSHNYFNASGLQTKFNLDVINVLCGEYWFVAQIRKLKSSVSKDLVSLLMLLLLQFAHARTIPQWEAVA